MTKTNMLMVAMYDWENKRLHTQFGLCWYFKSVFDIDNLEYEFPEIYAKRTNTITYPWTQHYWFKNREERINVLKEVLNMYPHINL